MTRKTCLHLALLPLFAVLALGSSSKGAKDKEDDKATTTTTSAAAAIGTPVLLGDAEWTVLDVINRGTTMKGNESYEKDATTAGTFVQVHFKVANKGKKEGTIGELPKLVDATGREFGTYETASSYRPKNTNGVFLDKIQPSLSKEFYEIFELPAGITTLSFKAHDFGLFGKEKAIGLGALPAAPAAPAAAVAPAKGGAAAAPAAAKAKVAAPATAAVATAAAAPSAKPAAAPAAAPAPAAASAKK